MTAGASHTSLAFFVCCFVCFVLLPSVLRLVVPSCVCSFVRGRTLNSVIEETVFKEEDEYADSSDSETASSSAPVVAAAAPSAASNKPTFGLPSSHQLLSGAAAQGGIAEGKGDGDEDSEGEEGEEKGEGGDTLGSLGGAANRRRTRRSSGVHMGLMPGRMPRQPSNYGRDVIDVNAKGAITGKAYVCGCGVRRVCV